MTIKQFALQFGRAVSVTEFKAGGFTRAQIERAVRDGILVWRSDGNLEVV